MRTIHGRFTNDYSPTMPGSKQEQAAYNARREMMNQLDSARVRRDRRSGCKAALAKLEKLRLQRA